MTGVGVGGDGFMWGVRPVCGRSAACRKTGPSWRRKGLTGLAAVCSLRIAIAAPNTVRSDRGQDNGIECLEMPPRGGSARVLFGGGHQTAEFGTAGVSPAAEPAGR